MNRILICVVVAVAYLMFRSQGAVPIVPPIVPPVVVPSQVPFPDIAQAAQALSTEERKALAETYGIVGRAIAADPESDRVFTDTAAVRRGHRAALLFVYKGVLSAVTGKAPGLREALEGAVNQRIGDADVPLNPELQQAAAKAFTDIQASLQ